MLGDDAAMSYTFFLSACLVAKFLKRLWMNFHEVSGRIEYLGKWNN